MYFLVHLIFVFQVFKYDVHVSALKRNWYPNSQKITLKDSCINSSLVALSVCIDVRLITYWLFCSLKVNIFETVRMGNAVLTEMVESLGKTPCVMYVERVPRTHQEFQFLNVTSSVVNHLK